MRHEPAKMLLLAGALVVAGLGATRGAEPAAAAAAPAKGSAYQYAVANPVEDAALRSAPTLGASVPQTVTLVPFDDGSEYAYFYYAGKPVIVEMTTRSVVRVERAERR